MFVHIYIHIEKKFENCSIWGTQSRTFLKAFKYLLYEQAFEKKSKSKLDPALTPLLGKGSSPFLGVLLSCCNEFDSIITNIHYCHPISSKSDSQDKNGISPFLTLGKLCLCVKL